MKLTAFILLVFGLHLSAKTVSQTITLTGKELPLEKVLAVVKEQTGYTALYDETVLKLFKPVSVNADNQQLERFLEAVFSQQSLHYAIKKNTILIRAKSNPNKKEALEALSFLPVNGRITDDEGNPIASVSVIVKGAKTGTVTDAAGMFRLNVAEGELLIVSFIGYETQQIRVSSTTATDMHILLKKSISNMQEVVVNKGYYSERKQLSTGSVAAVSGKEMEKQPVNNFLSGLQGRMAGVHITQTTSVAGGGMDIQIRGLNSIRTEGNEPLYVVDGVPFSSQRVSTNITSGTAIGGIKSLSPLNTINPNDIASVEILKDADATAIYGSRGANGVVLISTKKGKTGKSTIDMHVFTGLGKVVKTLPLMNTPQYLAMRREAFTNDGIAYAANDYDVNGTWDTTRYTDWKKVLIGNTAATHTAQVSISGGSSTTQYLLSGTFHRETTAAIGNGEYRRGGMLMNLAHKSPDNRFHLNFSSALSTDRNTLPGADLTFSAFILPPNAPALYDTNGKLNWEDGTFENPLAKLEGKYQANTYNLVTNAVLSYTVLHGLEAKINLGMTDYRLDDLKTDPHTGFNPSYGLGSESSALMTNTGTQRSWIVEPQLNWQATAGKGHITMLGGATFQRQQSKRSELFGAGFSSDALITNMAAAKNVYMFNNENTVYKYQAFFGRLHYNWQDRYLINFTARRDGSSRFGPGNRYANFGAIGGAWIFTKTTWMRNKLPAVVFGKLRASYGTTGNDQIGDYQYLDTYQGMGNNYDGSVGLQPSRLRNSDFGWETNRKFEVALETSWLKERLYASVAWFRNRSGNQLVGVPLPATTGFTSLQDNLDAVVQNTGLEIETRAAIIQTSKWKWSTTFNLTALNNKLVRFPGLEASTYASQLVIGHSLSVQKTYHYTGIDALTGLFQFEDYNKDGLINTSDRQSVQETRPEYYGGLGNQISYKNWELDCLFQFVKQQSRNYLYAATLVGGMANPFARALNHWPQDGVNAESQRYSTGNYPDVYTTYSRHRSSDASISDGSFVRLKTVSISYQLPGKWLGGMSGKLYLQGQNLFTFTGYKGNDPESQSMFYLPLLRQITAGLQLKF